MNTTFEAPSKRDRILRASCVVMERSQQFAHDLSVESCPDLNRHRFNSLNTRFQEMWLPFEKSLDTLTPFFDNYNARHPASVRKAVKAEVAEIELLLRSACGCVAEMRNVSADAEGLAAPVKTLISDFAASVFQSALHIHILLDEIVEGSFREQVDPYAGKSYPRWDVSCELCFGPILEAFLIPADAQHPSQGAVEAPVFCSKATRKFIDERLAKTLFRDRRRASLVFLTGLSEEQTLFCADCLQLYDDKQSDEGIEADDELEYALQMIGNLDGSSALHGF